MKPIKQRSDVISCFKSCGSHTLSCVTTFFLVLCKPVSEASGALTSCMLFSIATEIIQCGLITRHGVSPATIEPLFESIASKTHLTSPDLWILSDCLESPPSLTTSLWSAASPGVLTTHEMGSICFHRENDSFVFSTVNGGLKIVCSK